MEQQAVLAIAIGFAIAGCEGKDLPPPSQPAVKAAAAPDSAATFMVGQLPEVGCFAWSSRLEAAVCINGGVVRGRMQLQIEWLGAVHGPIRLGDLDDRTATFVNDELANGGFRRFVDDGLDLTVGVPAELDDVSVTWKRERLAAPRGDHLTHNNSVWAICKGNQTRPLDQDAEGDRSSSTARRIGDHVLVEVKNRFTRDGVAGEELAASLLDGSCGFTQIKPPR